MDSEKVWALFWFGVVVAICTLIGSCTVINQNDNAREAQDIQRLVSMGKTPIEARCAVKGYGEEKSALVCQAAALGKTQENGNAKQ